MLLNFNYLDTKRLSYTRNLLEHTLLIEMDKIDEDIKDLLNDNVNALWEILHNICIKQLNNYALKFEDYFPSIKNHSNINYYSYNFYAILHSYLLKNIKLHLYLTSTFNSLPNELISFKQAIIDYITRYPPEEGEISQDKLDSLVSNYRTKFKNFRKDNNILAKKPILYNTLVHPIKNNPYEVYKVSSNVFIYTLSNWMNCKYNYKEKAKIKNDVSTNEKSYDYTSCDFNKTKKFCKKFLEKDIDLKDLFVFERIYNIHHTLCSYFYPKIYIDSLSQEEELELFKGLFPIAYLPNPFENNILIKFFIDIYNDLYKYYNFTEFINGLKKFCLDFSLYFIPLYNMLYTDLVNTYCNLKKINIKEFINTNLHEFGEMVVDYKKSYFNMLDKTNFDKTFPEHTALFKPSMINKDQIFNTMNFAMTACFNFNLFNKRSLIEDSFNFKNKILSSFIYDLDKYQKNLKEFILNVLDNSNIDMINQDNLT